MTAWQFAARQPPRAAEVLLRRRSDSRTRVVSGIDVRIIEQLQRACTRICVAFALPAACIRRSSNCPAVRRPGPRSAGKFFIGFLPCRFATRRCQPMTISYASPWCVPTDGLRHTDIEPVAPAVHCADRQRAGPAFLDKAAAGRCADLQILPDRRPISDDIIAPLRWPHPAGLTRMITAVVVSGGLNGFVPQHHRVRRTALLQSLPGWT